MAFIPKKGTTQAEPFKKAASTAITAGDALVFSSGYVTPATSAASIVAGVSTVTVTSASDDYASNTVIPVYMLTDDLVFEAPVGAGTASQTNVGNRYDLYNAGSVDLTATSHGAVTVVGVIDASTVLVKFNSAYEFKNAS